MTDSCCRDFSLLQAFGREFADGATVLVARADEVLRLHRYEVFCSKKMMVFDWSKSPPNMIWQHTE